MAKTYLWIKNIQDLQWQAVSDCVIIKEYRERMGDFMQKLLYNGRIMDVHTHFTVETSRFAEDADKIGFTVENKGIDEHLAFMDREGISYAVLSCPTQKYMDDRDRCVAYCRQVNDLGARIVREYPDRFGFAAALPLPWADEAVDELKRAVTELGAKAVGLCSNYNGHYLGDKAFDEIFKVMNNLGCPGILHPAAPLDYPKNPVTGRILPMYEFITDTTRSVLDLFDAGTLLRYPAVKLVIPHSGSCLPVALDRFMGIMNVTGKKTQIPMDQLYFDLACDAFPRGVPILLNITDPSHILYGTDFPAIPEPVLKEHLYSAKTCPQLEGSIEKVMWENGARLFI